MAAKVLFAATLVLGVLTMLAGPGMPLASPAGISHSTIMWVLGGITAVVGAIGLVKTMKK